MEEHIWPRASGNSFHQGLLRRGVKTQSGKMFVGDIDFNAKNSRELNEGMKMRRSKMQLVALWRVSNREMSRKVEAAAPVTVPHRRAENKEIIGDDIGIRRVTGLLGGCYDPLPQD